MWWERRITMVPVPYSWARRAASSQASQVSQGPGRRPPSQVATAFLSLTMVGSPVAAMAPRVSSSR